MELTQQLFEKGCAEGELHYLDKSGAAILSADTGHWQRTVDRLINPQPPLVFDEPTGTESREDAMSNINFLRSDDYEREG